MDDSAKALKEKATELYKRGQFAVAVEAYEDARKAAANKRDVDVSTLAVLHANKAAALLALSLIHISEPTRRYASRMPSSA